MNEPLNNADTEHGVLPENAADPWQDVTLRKAVYDRMIKAIRSADRDHIITVEALWRMDKLPAPSEMGWSNMMYQLHSYDKEKKTTKQLIRSMKRQDANTRLRSIWVNLTRQYSAVTPFRLWTALL